MENMTEKNADTAALRENERLDRVNDDIELIQRTDGLTFGTDALLLASYIEPGARRALEIGGGTGIISLLCLARGRFDTVECCEVQELFADIIKRNAEHNGFSERLTVKNADIRELETKEPFDAVFTNPPYMRSTSGRANENPGKNIARHEIHGGIDDFCAAAKRLLRFGGSFYAVYRPDRLCDLISAMKNARLEPKRMTLVHADIQARPSMILIEGRMGGKPALVLTRPLVIYKDRAHKLESEDMKYILEKGAFPDDFSGRSGKRNDGK